MTDHTPSNRRIDACLSVRNGRLHIEDCDTVELAERFGTPLFVMSEGQLRRNVRRFQKEFGTRWPFGPVQILPAIKANWNLAVRQVLSSEGAGCDVFSSGELQAAIRSGTPPELISVNGGGKSDEHLRECIVHGVRITVDDLDELDRIGVIAATLDKQATIRLRLRPELPGGLETSDFSLEPVPVDLAFQVYKSGIPTEHVVDLGRRALQMKHVDLVGFHIHMGRHHQSLRVWRRLMQSYVGLIASLRDSWNGYLPREIDVGGGIPTPRDPFGKIVSRMDGPLTTALWLVLATAGLLGDRFRNRVASALVKHFVKTPHRASPVDVADYAKAITSALREEFARHGIDPSGMTLQVEPGRSLYGDAGLHLSRVLKTKHQTRPIPWNWVLLDTTYFFLAGGVLEYNLHDFVVANKPDTPAEMTADIVGRSCFADRILPEVRVPRLEAGDLMALLDTGAYQEASASNFNALPRPAMVLVHGDQAEVIRRAETVEDVFRRDEVPVRLRERDPQQCDK